MPDPAARSSSTAARGRARRWSRCTARPTSSTPTRASVASRGGVLFVGPHQPYLDYVADILPGLGEEGVETCTLRDLVRRGSGRRTRARPGRGPAQVRRGHREGDRARRPPCTRSRRPKGMVVETPWADVWLSADDWAQAFEAPERGTPHNEAREQVLEELLDDPHRPARRRGCSRPSLVRRSLLQNDELMHDARQGVAAPRSRRMSWQTSGRCPRTCAGALRG